MKIIASLLFSLLLTSCTMDSLSEKISKRASVEKVFVDHQKLPWIQLIDLAAWYDTTYSRDFLSDLSFEHWDAVTVSKNAHEETSFQFTVLTDWCVKSTISRENFEHNFENYQKKIFRLEALFDYINMNGRALNGEVNIIAESIEGLNAINLWKQTALPNEHDGYYPNIIDIDKISRELCPVFSKTSKEISWEIDKRLQYMTFDILDYCTKEIATHTKNKPLNESEFAIILNETGKKVLAKLGGDKIENSLLITRINNGIDSYSDYNYDSYKPLIHINK